jgi:hypothetical protein
LNDPLAPVRVMTMFPSALAMFVAVPSPILKVYTYWPMILPVDLERDENCSSPNSCFSSESSGNDRDVPW